jgi:hypothetical protein
VRDLIQRYTETELKESYFDRLIVQWQHENGPLDGLYSDPRGHLHEPHTSARHSRGGRLRRAEMAL